MTATRFFSDNAAKVHPAVMEAMAAANHVDTAYDGDALSQSLDATFSEMFETDCEVVWIPTGTAANSIILAHFVRPWQGILCYEEAHIEVDECGAPTFYSGGAKLMTLPGHGAKIDAEALKARIAGIRKDVHQVQPAAISITNATEYGLVWRADEISEISAIARANGMKLHMDGARFANAVVALDCHPGDITWRAGVDVLSLGVIKNGGMNAEALVFFPDSAAAATFPTDAVSQFEYRRKRGGHLVCKGRYMAAQVLAYIESGVWRRNAERANRLAQRIGVAAGTRLTAPVATNQVFVKLGVAQIAAMLDAGFAFYPWGPASAGEARFVVSWDTADADVDALCAALAGN